jgi:hypothetical protein
MAPSAARMANQRRTPASSLERGLMITGMIPEDAVFRECLQRFDSGTMTPVAGLGVRYVPLLALWPWGDGQPHGERAYEEIEAWIEGWLRRLPGIA